MYGKQPAREKKEKREKTAVVLLWWSVVQWKTWKEVPNMFTPYQLKH